VRLTFLRSTSGRGSSLVGESRPPILLIAFSTSARSAYTSLSAYMRMVSARRNDGGDSVFVALAEAASSQNGCSMIVDGTWATTRCGEGDEDEGVKPVLVGLRGGVEMLAAFS